MMVRTSKLRCRGYLWLWLIICSAALLSPVSVFAQWWGSKGTEIDQLAPLLQLKPGMALAEVGAGSGAVTVAAAQKVGPSGHIYATEIDPKRLEEIRQAVELAGLTNVSVIESTPAETRIPAECCDGIYMIGVYHHFTQPLATDASIFRALRPGGRLVIADFRPSLLLKPWTPEGVPANRGGHGIPPNILEDELTQSGFRIVQVYDHWGSSWFLSSFCVVATRPLGDGTAPMGEPNESRTDVR